ncbi:MAG: hypothetical protein LQ346_006122 [Caloplaca aetnensis]|nr:MAG: hypothetical protein LQ346_006122 [Caloplaca aetnensis]
MSFRKRNVGLSGPSLQSQATGKESSSPLPPGVRPSPLDGRLTTSTGTLSLDDILGHSGFALGNSLLIEENGTTEFATTLLRYFAAEGVVQGHKVHLVGVGEPWARDLPGVVGIAGEDNARLESRTGPEKERMKIAWRYERLGEFGTGPSSARAPPTFNRNPILESSPGKESPTAPPVFCHAFDLTKRLPVPDSKVFNFIPIRVVSQPVSPFHSILEALKEHLASSPSSMIHRVLIPVLLSPVIYPSHASSPQYVLQFLHSLRALLRQYPTQLVIMMTLPLMLYPRSTGLSRWMELLSDGVIELSPFPNSDLDGPSKSSGAATAQEEKPQGMVKVHSLPVFSEKGGGGASGDDLAFTVSRRKFVIKPFNLPPVEGDTEAQKGEGDGKPTKVEIDF